MKTVIEMAREAGGGLESDYTNISALERFAELVRADERNRTWTQEHWTEYERSIAAQEREACAEIAETAADCLQNSTFEGVANAIRARSNT